MCGQGFVTKHRNHQLFYHKNGSFITDRWFYHKAQRRGDVPWVHLDINGRSPTDGKTARNYLPEGGSGFGVRLFVELVSDFD